MTARPEAFEEKELKFWPESSEYMGMGCDVIRVGLIYDGR